MAAAQLAGLLTAVLHGNRICFDSRKINFSHVFAGQTVGVTQVGDRVWLVTFMHYDLRLKSEIFVTVGGDWSWGTERT